MNLHSILSFVSLALRALALGVLAGVGQRLGADVYVAAKPLVGLVYAYAAWLLLAIYVISCIWLIAHPLWGLLNLYEDCKAPEGGAGRRLGSARATRARDVSRCDARCRLRASHERAFV